MLMVIMPSLAMDGFAQTNLVTPAQYLASQPKPNFAVGNHMHTLTTWAISPASNAVYELANNWGYAVPLCLNFPYATPSVASNSAVRGTEQYGQIQIVKSNPTKFKLSVLLDRTLPTNVPSGFWSTNSAGLFVDYYSNTWSANILTNGTWVNSNNPNSTDWKSNYPWMSPETPDTFMATRTEYEMKSLRMIQSNCPISIILNGGEYDLQDAGWGQPVWQQDARVQAQAVMTNAFNYPYNATNVNGMSWCKYSSLKKAHTLGFLTSAIQQQLPNRELYIFYNTDNEEVRGYTPTDLHWMDFFSQWGWWSDYMNTNTDLPSFEEYYGCVNDWTNTTTGLLTKYLNAVGYDINLGYKTNYSWVCGGWDNLNNEALTNQLSDIPTYTGFLKCLYTAGMNGAIAGYFANPPPTNNGIWGRTRIYWCFSIQLATALVAADDGIVPCSRAIFATGNLH